MKIVALSALLGLIGTTASAQNTPAGAQSATTGSAQSFLQTRHDEVNRILRRPARTPADESRVRNELTRALQNLLDYDELGRQALGSNWATRTEPERREFVSLLRQLVERSYQSNLRSTLDFEIRYLGETAQGADGALVRTAARSRAQRRSPEIAIDYTLKRNGNVWRVADVTTDGVSLVRNYRTQFNRIIQREGFPALLDRMRSRLAEGNAI